MTATPLALQRIRAICDAATPTPPPVRIPWTPPTLPPSKAHFSRWRHQPTLGAHAARVMFGRV